MLNPSLRRMRKIQRLEGRSRTVAKQAVDMDFHGPRRRSILTQRVLTAAYDDVAPEMADMDD